MKRWMKKSIAFILALSMILGSESLIFAEAATKSEVTVLSKNVYDDAVALDKNVAFIENGGFRYASDATTKTKITFMNPNGKKTVITNKNSSGKKLFDCVYGPISGGYLNLEKDGKYSIIKEDGSYFGGSLKYYYGINYVNDDLMFVATNENATKWKLINSSGTTILSGLSNQGVYFGYANDKYIYTFDDSKLYILNNKGKIIATKTYEGISFINCYDVPEGYLALELESGFAIIDEDGNRVIKSTNYYLYDATYLEDGYVLLSSKDETKQYVRNIETGKNIYSNSNIDYFDGNIIVGTDSNDVISVTSIDGKIDISDLKKHLKSMVDVDVDQISVDKWAQISDKTVAVSVNDTGLGKTIVLKKSSNLAVKDAVELEGLVDYVSADGKYVTTSSSWTYSAIAVYSTSGTLLKKFTGSKLYKYPSVIGYNNSNYLFKYYVYENEDDWYSDGSVFITKDGKLYSGSVYNYSGYFSITNSAGTTKLYNSSSKKVYTYSKEDDIFICTLINYPYFLIGDWDTMAGTLYDDSGNKIYDNVCIDEETSSHLYITCKESGDDYKYGCISLCDHTYKSKVTKKATRTENGKIKYTCSKCGRYYTKTIYKASTIELSKDKYTYNGNVKSPSVIVKDSKGNVISSSNYEITKATGRKNVGTYKYVIKFKNKYSGTKSLYFKINPSTTSIPSKITALDNAFTVKWDKVTKQISGYEIKYATNSSFTKNEDTVKISGYKNTSKTISNLESGQKYYVKVRAYKVVDGKTYYSSWSKYRTVTTK